MRHRTLSNIYIRGAADGFFMHLTTRVVNRDRFNDFTYYLLGCDAI
jgi:hypothetical protein